ncbi:MAG: translocation/assembly module TamB domain-containing protein, partial [Candidatus Aminicenantia bacterium]
YNLFSEMDGYVSGNLNYGRENLYIQMKNIKIKGIQGDGNLKLDKGNLEISGNFNEVSLRELKDSNLLKTFVDLSFIPSIEGRGNFDMKILGDMKNLVAEAELNFKDVKISKFNAGNISGKLKGPIRELNFEGTFKNGIFEGTAKGSTGKRELQIEIEKMNEERISGFLKVPLNGFVNISFKNGISAEGKLNAPFLKIKSIELKNLSIPFNFEDETFNTSFTFSTKISESNGFLSFSMKNKKYKFSTSQITFELSEFYKNLKGTWEISLNGEGEIYSSQVDIKGKIRDFSFKTDSIRNYVLEGKIGINKNSLSASGNLLSTDKKDYLQFSTEIVRDGSIKGTFEGKIISIEKIIKFPGEGVNVRFLGEISGKYDSLKIQSISNFEGRSFFIKGFAHDFRDFSGTLQQIKDMLYLKNFRAKIGGGEVMGFGEARIENLSLENINVNLEGEKMRLAPFEKVDGIGDGRIELRGNLDEITIDGSFFVNRVFWRKEIGEKIAFSSAPSPPDSPKVFKKINLNIELISNGNAWMDNSWGKAEGKFNLRIKGDSSNPILLGTISGTRGELIVGDRRFKLIKADIYFNSPFIIDPELYILADTYVKDYRVIFEVKGKASKPLPALSSSPPLPPQDILTLLALGEIYQRTSYRTGTQLGSASLISMELSEQLKTKAKKLFGLDRLRVDPYLLGSSSNPVARVTLGKKISKDLVVLYSSDLTGQREYIVYIEYSISDNLSLIGMRNENGALSFDFKLVKRISQ